MSADAAPKRRTAMKLRWRLLFTVLFYGPAIYFKIEGDSIAASICAVGGIAAFSGFRAGAVYIFALLGAVSASVAAAPSIGISQEATFAQWIGTTGLTNRFLSVAVFGLLITLAVSTILILVGKRIMKDRPRLAAANQWIGFGVGALEGVAALVFFLGGMLVVEPIEEQRASMRDPNDSRGKFVSQIVRMTCHMTRESRLGPTIVAYNPFTRIPQLNKVEEVQQSVRVLSDPAKIQGLLHHPSIRHLQRRPEVREVVEKLTSDPEIRAILYSGKSMDRNMAMRLLNHPAVMELVDQPGFVEEASKVIQNAGPHGT